MFLFLSLNHFLNPMVPVRSNPACKASLVTKPINRYQCEDKTFACLECHLHASTFRIATNTGSDTKTEKQDDRNNKYAPNFALAKTVLARSQKALVKKR